MIVRNNGDFISFNVLKFYYEFWDGLNYNCLYRKYLFSNVNFCYPSNLKGMKCLQGFTFTINDFLILINVLFIQWTLI